MTLMTRPRFEQIAGFVGTALRALLDKLRERPSVLDYIDPARHAGLAAGTDAADCSAGFIAALAAHHDVHVPAGTYPMADAVAIAAGKRLRTAGRRKTTIRMLSTFNASALGCFVFTGGEPGPTIEGFTFIQDQPDSATPTVYPPCIYARNTPRFQIKNVRMACVYAGIDMKGNSGGAVIDDLELSPLSVGIDIDGALDSVKIHKLHLWPFGGAGAGTLTTNQRVAYTAAYGLKSGRCDDLHVSDSLFFSQINAAYFYNSASGYTFGSLTNVDFDDRGGLNVVTDSRIQLLGGTFTMGKTDSWFVKMSGGVVSIDGARFAPSAVNASANGLIELSGGTLALGSGCTLNGSTFDVQLVYAANATLKVDGCNFTRAANTAYTAAMIRAINTKGHAVGCFCSDVGTGSGKFAQIDTDTGFVVRGNNLRGWAVGVPATSALANTMVDGNLGAGANKDTFVGYFSGDAATTVKLPNGWTVAKAATGTYNMTHNLSLADAKDMIPQAMCDLTATGAFAAWDIAASTANVLRLRTYVGTTLTDSGVAFVLRRFRS